MITALRPVSSSPEYYYNHSQEGGRRGVYVDKRNGYNGSASLSRASVCTWVCAYVREVTDSADRPEPL